VLFSVDKIQEKTIGENKYQIKTKPLVGIANPDLSLLLQTLTKRDFVFVSSSVHA